MKLTPKLKSWLEKNRDVKAGSPDADYREAAADALVDETLSQEKLFELTKSKEDEAAGAFDRKLDALASGLEKLTTALTAKDADDEEEEETDEDETAVDEAAEDEKGKKKKKKRKPAFLEDDDEEEEEDEEEEKPKKPKKSTKGTAPRETKVAMPALAKMVARMGYGARDDEPDDNGKTFVVRVKAAVERYDDTKTALTYPATTKSGRSTGMAGRPVFDFGGGQSPRPLNVPSERDKAIAGAYAKFLIASSQRGGSKTFGFAALPEHDRDILLWTMENADWSGHSGQGDPNYADIKGRLTPNQQKALIDDATSGGLEAAPIVFDDQVIQAPLLNGELYPLVNVIPLDRGRRVEGVSVGTVTGSWGGVDDTAISLFNTASYVSAFDTTIFRWEGAIRIGLDFLSDTPIDFGALITAQYGERLLEDLDDVIATGNGTTQPEGIMTKSGTTSVAFGGATSLGNYESLLFGINKAERKANMRASTVFVGNETSYERARALPVGSSDARRLGGSQATIGGVSDYVDYTWMGHPYKINESLANTQIFYAVLARYRMYRRRGLTIRTSTEGDTLMRANEMLIIALARFGGALERGACAAVTSTAPA